LNDQLFQKAISTPAPTVHPALVLVAAPEAQGISDEHGELMSMV
jgi:hypothetical protein